MSQTLNPLANVVERTVNKAAEHIRAHKRRKGHPVRCGAIDYLEIEARRSRRLAPTSYEDELDQHRAAIDMVEAWQAKSVEEGPARYRGIFGTHGVATFRLLSEEMRRGGDGRADLAYAQIARATGQKIGSVFDRYHALIDAGVIAYQPRSIHAGMDGQGRGLRVQMSSVCWLTPDRFPSEWRSFFETRLAFYREQRAERERRREAAERRRLAQGRLEGLCAAKAERAREGGTPPRQARPVRTLDPLKVNARGMMRLADETTARAAVAADAEQADADKVAARLAELQAAARAQWR